MQKLLDLNNLPLLKTLIRYAFFTLIVRPIVLVGLGLNVRNRERLPKRGPAIVVANHNSHLDTAVLITLFSWRSLRWLRPVAAADYFLSNPLLAWFALNVMGIIPISRKLKVSGGDPLAGCEEAIARRETLILFPEGSRGEPEQLSEFKTGIAHLAKRHPDVPVIPVFMHGLGKALPKGEFLPIPFFCDVFVGEALFWSGDRAAFMADLQSAMAGLASEGHFDEWN